MITEQTLEVAKATAEELRRRGEGQRADAIEALVEAARPSALPALDLLTTGEAADLLGVTAQTIKNWIRSGHLPGYRIGGRFMIPRDALAEYVRRARSSLDLDEISDADAARLVTDGRRHLRDVARPSLTDQGRRLLDRVRAAVCEVEPHARIVLYGSRARGDATPDSDWDFLVLLDGPVDHRRAEAIRGRLLDVELETGAVFSVIVESTREWDSPLFRAMPLHASIDREGIQL